MHPVVPTSALQAALAQVPLTPPEQEEADVGWVMDGELVRRWQEFGPLREGVHEMAAHALADVAEAMLDSPVCDSTSRRILLLAGPGGNGADGLRAGRVLAERGRKVDVMVLLTGDGGYSLDYPESHDNAPLLAALITAGGRVITGSQVIEEDINRSHALLLEAIVGSGFQGTLTGLMASWAEISGWVPSLAVDVPAGVAADTGDLPRLRGQHGQRRRPPTVTLALGALRQAHTTAHCGNVLLARCGLTAVHESTTYLSRAIGPDPGFPVPETVDTLFRDGGMPVADRWTEVQPTSVCAVIGGVDCLGFGHLALQALRGAGTWHRLSLVAGEETARCLVADHPDVDVVTAAAAGSPTAWVVETRDPDTLTEVLRHSGKVILGPRAIETLDEAGRLPLVLDRQEQTIVITRDPRAAEVGVGAVVMELAGRIITTHRPDNHHPGQIVREHDDAVVPLWRVQGIEAVLAGFSAVTTPHLALALLADRMRALQPSWPVTAADLTRSPRGGAGPGGQ